MYRKFEKLLQVTEFTESVPGLLMPTDAFFYLLIQLPLYVHILSTSLKCNRVVSL